MDKLKLYLYLLIQSWYLVYLSHYFHRWNKKQTNRKKFINSDRNTLICSTVTIERITGMKNHVKDNFSIYKWVLPIVMIVWPLFNKAVSNQNIIFVTGLIAITISSFIFWVGESNKLKFGNLYVFTCIFIIVSQFILKFVS